MFQIQKNAVLDMSNMRILGIDKVKNSGYNQIRMNVHSESVKLIKNSMDKRKAILDATAKLINEHGLQNTPMSMIAKAADTLLITANLSRIF